MQVEDDPLLKELRTLPEEPLDELLAERVRRRAQRVLLAERRLQRWPHLSSALHAVVQLARGLLPLSLSGAVAVYLIWAIQFTNQLHEGRGAPLQAQLRYALLLLVG